MKKIEIRHGMTKNIEIRHGMMKYIEICHVKTLASTAKEERKFSGEYHGHRGSHSEFPNSTSRPRRHQCPHLRHRWRQKLCVVRRRSKALWSTWRTLPSRSPRTRSSRISTSSTDESGMKNILFRFNLLLTLFGRTFILLYFAYFILLYLP